MDFTIGCACGCPGGATLLGVTGGQLEAWRVVAQRGQISRLTCPDCGCCYNLADGTTQIDTVDVSKPKITSLNVVSGTKAGGTAVIVAGHALDMAGLVIKFAGKPGVNLRSVTDDHATIDTPVGRVKLNTQGRVQRKLLTTAVAGGPFQVGETVTGGTSGKTAIVREVGAANAFLYVDTWTGEFTAAETITGGTSGATGTAGTFQGLFQAAEVLTGQTSAHTGTLVGNALSPLTIDAPSGGFTAAEWVKGGTSEAKMQLAAANHFNGLVDVDVSNVNGARAEGLLVGGFTYT